MLISTHSLHHTQCSVSSAPVSSFSVLVYPDHHLQSLPIPSLLLASPPSVPLVRLPLFCSHLFPRLSSAEMPRSLSNRCCTWLRVFHNSMAPARIMDAIAELTPRASAGNAPMFRITALNVDGGYPSPPRTGLHSAHILRAPPFPPLALVSSPSTRADLAHQRISFGMSSTGHPTGCRVSL